MRLGAAAVAAVAVAAVVAVRIFVGGDAPASDAPSSHAVTGDREYGGGAAGEATDPGLPPDDAEVLAEMFDPALARIGLRLARGGLADGPGAAADPSRRDRHLALYVEPLSGDPSAADYLDTLVTSARVFLPSVFDTWPELVSMDVCQEPPESVDDRAVPPPVTVLEVTRAEAAGIDWPTVDLAALVEASDQGRLHLFLAEAVRPGS